MAMNIFCRKDMRNCFNHILIAINICDRQALLNRFTFYPLNDSQSFPFSLHLIFASMDAVRNSFGEFYPVHLLYIFPYIHYPFYR